MTNFLLISHGFTIFFITINCYENRREIGYDLKIFQLG